MKINDTTVSKAIVKNYFDKFLDMLELEVALVGGGPSNLVCGILLGEKGIKTAVFESKLAPGGGMWGGGMMFNEIVIQKTALELLKQMGITHENFGNGYYTADSVEATSTLISRCIKSGTRIFNLIKVVDVMFGEDFETTEKSENKKMRINGLVLNWTPVEQLSLHVDPITISSQFVVDGTGHPAEVCSIIGKKMNAELDTRTGKVIGEMSMWADRGEELTLENSSEIFPGLYVTGMAANAAKGAPRMGPIFGGMLLSGEKIANELISRLR